MATDWHEWHDEPSPECVRRLGVTNIDACKVCALGPCRDPEYKDPEPFVDRIDADVARGQAWSSGPPGIPVNRELTEARFQDAGLDEPPRMLQEKAFIWDRQNHQLMRDRVATLAELEKFCHLARSRGAPDHALVFALPSVVRVGWYAE